MLPQSEKHNFQTRGQSNFECAVYVNKMHLNAIYLVIFIVVGLTATALFLIATQLCARRREIMNTRLLKQDHYGVRDLQGLAARCDWFVSGAQLVQVKRTDRPRVIFISAWQGDRAVPFFAHFVLPRIAHPFNLVIASEDATFPGGVGDARLKYFDKCQAEIAEILDNGLVNRVFVENLDSSHPKCYPIPLGILRYNPAYDRYQRLLTSTARVADLPERRINVLCCHRIRDGPQWEKRRRVSRMAQSEWSQFVTHFDQNDDEAVYFERLKQAKFCLCVRGGGYDPSPRCWQAILCGAIPIIEHSPVDRAYERLPVVFVDAWSTEAVSESKLEQWMQKLAPYYTDAEKRALVLQMLTLDYWYNIVLHDTIAYECIAEMTPEARAAKEGRVKFTFGSAARQCDVTALALRTFLRDGVITVPATLDLNALFSDVCFDVQNNARIEFADGRETLVLHSTGRMLDIVVPFSPQRAARKAPVRTDYLPVWQIASLCCADLTPTKILPQPVREFARQDGLLR
jgi:hypothetical protein